MRKLLSLWLVFSLVSPAFAESMSAVGAPAAADGADNDMGENPTPPAPPAPPATPGRMQGPQDAADHSSAPQAPPIPPPAPVAPEMICTTNICRYEKHWDLEQKKTDDVTKLSIYQSEQMQNFNAILATGPDATNQLEVELALRYRNKPDDRENIAKFMALLNDALGVKFTERESVDNLVTVSTTTTTEYFLLLTLAWKVPAIVRLLRAPGKVLAEARMAMTLTAEQRVAMEQALAQSRGLPRIYKMLSRRAAKYTGSSKEIMNLSLVSLAVAHMVAFYERRKTPYWNAMDLLRVVQAYAACDLHNRAVDYVKQIEQAKAYPVTGRQSYVNWAPHAETMISEAKTLVSENDMLTNMYPTDEVFTSSLRNVSVASGLLNDPLQCQEIALPETIRILGNAAIPQGQ